MRHPARLRLAPLVALVLGALAAGRVPRAEAEPLPPTVDYSAAIAALSAPVWAGPRVPFPIESDRPHAAIHGRSIDSALTVHGAAGSSDAAIEAAMRGAAFMQHALRVRGFDRPYPDGDLGGGPEFDVYLVEDAPVPYEIVSDGPTVATYLDGIVAHVRLDARLPVARLEACAAEAYASALLAELDPAEAPSWRRATAEYLMWLLRGRFDACTDDTPEGQREPHLGYTAFDGPHAGALFLAMRSLRSDDGDATFVRETWTMARQRTWEGKEEGLRASPDLWQAIGTAATLIDQSLDRYLVDAAVARLALGSRARDRASSFRALDGLGAEYAAPFAYRLRYADLPIRTSPHAPALAPTGSAYASMDVSTAGPRDRLRIFLRGEAAVRWSLVAVLLGPGGEERSRVEAPVRERAWNAYLAVELSGASTVAVIVTNLGEYRPDANVPPVDERTFHLVFDRAAD